MQQTECSKTKIDFYHHQASFNQEHKFGLTLNELSKLFPILAIYTRKIKQLPKQMRKVLNKIQNSVMLKVHRNLGIERKEGNKNNLTNCT